MTILSATEVTISATPDSRKPGYRADLPPREVRYVVRIGNYAVAYVGDIPTESELNQWLSQRQQEESRVNAFNNSIQNFTFGGQTLASLKQMTNAEFDDWWDTNIDTLAKALQVLKLLTRAAIRRLL